MTARMLWTFASAYRLLRDEKYLKMAVRAKNYIIKHFYDNVSGGTWWSLNPDGTPLDTKKQIYAIAFTIYGLAELNRATGDGQALEYAIKLFNSIEDHSFDSEKDGYYEAFTRDWSPIEDMRLSEKDANESKTMNPEEELVDILLDFIIVAANLAKSINRTMKQKQIKEGGTVNGQNQRIGTGNQGPAQRRSHY